MPAPVEDAADGRGKRFVAGQPRRTESDHVHDVVEVKPPPMLALYRTLPSPS